MKSELGRRSVLTLRARIAATVLLASIVCALIAAILIGAVMLEQQKKFETQRINEAYSVATSDLDLGNLVSLDNGLPTINQNSVPMVRTLCHATGIGLVLIPSYVTANPFAAKTNFAQDSPVFQSGTRYNIGRQSASAISSLSQSSQTKPICGQSLSAAQVAYLEPLPGRSHSNVDLLLIGRSPSWFTIIRDAGLGTIAMLLGVLAVGSFSLRLVLKQLRAATLGYSTVQLAAILEEQEAMLQGISEGVAGCDSSGRIRFFNSEAQRILKLPKQSVGRPLSVLVRGARLRQVVTGEISGRDLPVVVGDSVVIVNHIKVNQGEQDLGFVVTMRDQTEWEGLLKELDSLVGMTSALRAQAHEFSNKLHTIIGLIEIGQPEEAVAFATEISLSHASISERLRISIGDPMITAMLIAKSASASEKAVDLIVDEPSSIGGRLISPSEILSVMGNLIDNAIDAASSGVVQVGWQTTQRGWVKVLVNDVDGDLFIDVRDSGPGIANEVLPDIFTDGFSTKSSRYGARRGLGLALVKQVISHAGGKISIKNDPGAHFEIVIPGAVMYPDSENSAESSDGVSTLS